ncbi:PAS domain S-box-containing protein [Mucilaginibacter gracilis]|uniref:Sensory/regulatory protein RpfC n=1 Tax=Mucilaginibacter gracilis TaxID=423350 RepID=A0A495J0R9_9SPHI|nr:ATP-binding protein [Mucilaginibacter gracilis]RKR81914.1 PAS domain S-box-containing protein [Mucilaginibacter gracilis]
MIRHGLLLEDEQFNRLFPFYILIGDGLIVIACGSTVKKLCPDLFNESFLDYVAIANPRHKVTDFNSLKAICNQLVVLTIRQTTIRGQFEFLKADNTILFVGSPWVDSVEKMSNFSLTAGDFAHHDQTIAYLQLLENKAQHNAEAFTGFMMNVTERKEIEDKLRTNEEKYRNIIANMNLGLLEVDNYEIITYANYSFCKMSGYSLDELMGKKASSLLATREEDTDLLKDKNNLRQRGVADAYEISVTDKKGNLKWWLISGAPRYNDNNQLVGSLGIHLDITKQKKLEGELIRAKIQAEQLGKTKENFLANMSHEIRTPMNAIMGMSSQLSKTDLTSQQKFYLDIIHSASDNLLVIINDILDLSKIEAGKLTFESIGFELKEVASRAIQVIIHKAEEKGIKIDDFYFDPNISPVLIGDPYRLNQVFLNLISNAIKFTDEGSVTLSFTLLNDSEASQLIKVEIADTGIGMDQNFVDHLFDKFSQEYESVSRTYGGTGLGMSICKQLIELMGGTISATSQKGQGTTIAFMVTFKKGNFTDLPKTEAFNLSKTFLTGKKVLVVDDNEMNRLVALICLQNYGAEVIEAANGEQAIEALKWQNVEVVLMDIQMPGINGFDTTKIIRDTGNNIPIIGLTANAIKGESEKCINAGMNDYIAKPFKEADLLRKIAKWLRANLANTAKPENEADELPSAGPLYDLSALKAISRGNDTFIYKMVSIFSEQAPQMVQEMFDAYRDNNLKLLGAVAHKIKPSLDNLNITSLAEIIRTIERADKEVLPNPNMPAMLKKVSDTVAKVIAMMNLEYPSH